MPIDGPCFSGAVIAPWLNGLRVTAVELPLSFELFSEREFTRFASARIRASVEAKREGSVNLMSGSSVFACCT